MSATNAVDCMFEKYIGSSQTPSLIVLQRTLSAPYCSPALKTRPQSLYCYNIIVVNTSEPDERVTLVTFLWLYVP